MSAITKSQLLAPQLRIVEIEVPELGGTVRLRELTTLQVETVRAARINEGETSNVGTGTRLLAMSIVDDAGQRLLADSESDQLLNLGLATVQALMRAVNQLNSFDQVDVVKN